MLSAAAFRRLLALPRARRGLGLAALTALSASCFTGSEGLVPPTDAFYFPTAVAISPGRETLYVVNSDFDLQYNGGTIFAINLGPVDGASGLAGEGTRAAAERVADAIAAGEEPGAVCAELGVSTNPNDTLHPGPCEAVRAAPFIQAHATIGGFGTALQFVGNQAGPGMRLFASVRGDPSITYFEVPDDRPGAGGSTPCGAAFCLECLGDGDENRCGESHRIGENLFTSQRGLLLPTEPVSLASIEGPFGDAIVSPHQTEGSASLVVNRWGTAGNTTPFEATPSLEYVLPQLAAAPTGITAIPAPRLVDALKLSYAPGFVLTHRASASLTVVRFEADEQSAPPRPFIAVSDSVPIALTNDGEDARGLAIDDSARRACEATCESTLCEEGADCSSNALFTSCLTECLETPVGFYLANRAPSSLIIGKLITEPVMEDGRVASLRESISLDEALPLPIGALGVGVGSIIDQDGELATRVFVSSYDSKFISVYDPTLRRIEWTMRTGRGPQSFAFDTDPVAKTSHLYVAQFTDSYVSVFDLDARRITFGTPLLNLGPTVAPREEQ